MILFFIITILTGMLFSSDYTINLQIIYNPKTADRSEVDSHLNNENLCKTKIRESRIAGGEKARRGEHPWVVGIGIQNETSKYHACGGTLINQCHVLTAAHCFKKEDGTDRASMSDYLIRLGDYNNSEHEEGEEHFQVESISLHPEYNENGLSNNDIAILKIKRKDQRTIKFSPFVTPACLPKEDWLYQPDLICTVAGWGQLGANSSSPDVLQSAEVPILSQETCRDPNVYGDAISEGMFCAGYLEGGIDTCAGDSGGPLICKVEGLHIVVGVTSWGGEICAAKNNPGVYTRVTSYLEWIHNTTK